MEQGTILRFEVLKQIDTGDPFDLIFVTADRRRGTGGDLVEVKGWKKITRENHPHDIVGSGINTTATKSKNPHHQEHKTINIFNPADPEEHPITVHWRLMVFFNHLRIIG